MPESRGANAPDLTALIDTLATLDGGAICVVDAEGRVRHVGGAVGLLADGVAGATIGHCVLDAFHDDDRAAVSHLLARVTDGGVVERAHLRARPRDGLVRWLEVAIRDAREEPAIGGIVVRVRDVTPEREVESLHVQRGELLDALQGAIFGSALGFWEWDAAADRLRWLNDWPHEHGLPPCDGDQHLAKLMAAIDPAHLERVRSAYRAHFAGRTPHFDVEYRVRALDGTYRWVAMRGRIVDRAADSAPVRAVGTAFDIDRRKRLEDALERRRLQFEAIAANVSPWIVLTDPELRIEYVSRAVFGVSPERLVGRHVEDCVGADAAALFARHHRIAIATGRAVRFTGTLDEGRRVLECRLEPVIVGGSVVGVASIVTEVTDRLALERAVLEISGREQQRFASDLHDGLGQDLTGIALHLRGLLRQAQTLGSPLARGLEEVLGYASGALTNVRQIARGVSPFARGQGGLAHALEDLGARMSADGGPSVNVFVAPDVPEQVDAVVAEHLYRIAQESVTNAVRHSGAGGIRVTLELDGARGALRLAVLDDGRGMPTGAEARAGLGLKLMQYRAEQIGGELHAGPGPVGGTRIECACPLRSAAPPSASA